MLDFLLKKKPTERRVAGAAAPRQVQVLRFVILIARVRWPWSDQMPRQWLVYVREVPDEQVDKVVVVPAYTELRIPVQPHWRPVKEEMKPGDRVWFFDAREPKPGIQSLCEVSSEYSDDKPHPADPDKYPRSYQRPVHVLEKFTRPISKKRLDDIARLLSWTDVPLTSIGNFKRNRVYCHAMPADVAIYLEKIAERRQSR